MFFGKSTYACVYRLADLVSYTHEEEKKTNSEGQEEIKHYMRFVFNNTKGMSNFRLGVSSLGQFSNNEQYFDKLRPFGNPLFAPVLRAQGCGDTQFLNNKRGCCHTQQPLELPKTLGNPLAKPTNNPGISSRNTGVAVCSLTPTESVHPMQG